MLPVEAGIGLQGRNSLPDIVELSLAALHCHEDALDSHGVAAVDILELDCRSTNIREDLVYGLQFFAEVPDFSRGIAQRAVNRVDFQASADDLLDHSDDFRATHSGECARSRLGNGRDQTTGNEAG